MFAKLFLITLTSCLLGLTAHSQQAEQAAPVQFRAVLHDPIHPTAELFYADKTGAIVPLNFRPADLTEALLTIPVNGSLVLYNKAVIDPQNPNASVAASLKIAPEIKRSIVVVLPAPEGEKPAYRLLMIDDSAKAFPPGESRVLPFIGIETAIQAGEHRLPVHPGKITSVPPVKKVNEYMMAQTNFYYQQGEAWVPFTERQLQYLDACRRLFIVHATPGALQPTVTTIVDTAPIAPAKVLNP